MQRGPGTKFLVEGFPRLLAQLTAYEERGGRVDGCISLELPDDVAASRLQVRQIHLFGDCFLYSAWQDSGTQKIHCWGCRMLRRPAACRRGSFF